MGGSAPSRRTAHARGGPGTSRPRRALLPILGLIAIAALLRFGFFAFEPPGRDQGVFCNLADGVLRGKLLYRDLWENKPPAVVWLYAAALALSGRSYVGIHALQAAFAVLTALVIVWLVRRSTGSLPAATAAGLLYVLHAGGLAFGGFWGTAQAEVFMDLPVALALALLLATRDSRGHVRLLATATAGLCIGWVALLKYSAAPLAGLVFLTWRAHDAMRERWVGMAAFAAGCLLPGATLAMAMAANGAWEDFFRATVTFNAAYRAATEPSHQGFFVRVFYSPSLLLALYVPAAIGFAGALGWRKGRPGAAARPLVMAVEARRLAIAAAGLWILTLAEVFWQGRAWLYHYHVVLLPLALLAGVGLARLLSFLGRVNVRMPAWASLLIVLGALSLPYGARLASYDRTHAISARWRGRASVQQMESTYTWGGADYEFAQTKAVALAIAREVPPGKRIFIWGFEPYVYFLSRRESASRFVYDLPLMPRFASVHSIFAKQLMDDLRRHPPARLLVVGNDANAVEPLDSVSQLMQWEELFAYIKANYVPIWRLGDFVCFAPRGEQGGR